MLRGMARFARVCAACAIFAGACRSRGARPDDVVRALDAAPSTSASTSAIASASDSASSAPSSEASNTAKNKPRAWFGGPRDRALATEDRRLEIDGDVSYFHVSSSEGIDARIANARIDRTVFASMGRDYFGALSPGYARNNNIACDGFVTARVLSWSCRDMSDTVDLAMAAQGMGGAPADYLVATFDVTFQDPEQTAGDALADVIAKRCSAPSDENSPNAGTLEPEPCKRTTEFSLGSVGLTLEWFSETYHYAQNVRVATIRWRAFGKKLRSDGAACSFEWSAPTDDDGPTPISQDEACR
jgi:hypothetical protein